jgi:hypothetical protein
MAEFLYDRKDFSPKKLIEYLREYPNVECISNGQRIYLTYSHHDVDGIFWNNRAGKSHSYDRFTTIPGSELEPGVEFQEICFIMNKGSTKRKVFYYG